MGLLAELHQPLFQAQQDQGAELLSLVVQPQPVLVEVGRPRGRQKQPGRPVAGLGKRGGVSVERLRRPGERPDIGRQRSPVCDEQRGQLQGRLVQAGDRPLQRGSIAVQGPHHRVVVADQASDRGLASGEGNRQLVQLDDQLSQVIPLRSERLHHAGAVFDELVEILTGSLQDRGRVLHEGRHRLRIDGAEIVLERTEQLVRFGGDGRAALRDGRPFGQCRPALVRREQLDVPLPEQ